MRCRLINLKLGHLLLGFAVTVAAGVALVSVGYAVVIPGGGPAKSDCYLSVNLPDVTVPLNAKPPGKEVDCMDGDPACDADNVCNNVCEMRAQLCRLQTGIAGCTPPAALKAIKFKSFPVTFTLQPPAGLTGSECGSFITGNVPVKVKKNGKKLPGVIKVSGSATAEKGTKPGKDSDTYIVKCLPRVGNCPTTTTTTTTTSSTTTTSTPPTCGDGAVTGNEQCDPPGQQGQCSTGNFCGLTCQCAPTVACACGAGTPTGLKFTTSVNQLTCGHGTDPSNANVVDLQCGTLWFGGGQVGVALPTLQPDLGVSFEKITQCSGTVFGLTNTTAADTGSSRTCTTVGCTFGAPLPVPNEAVEVVSNCVVNVVAQDAKGFGDCSTGQTNINLPLSSKLYLNGDLLPAPGIQPCPICVDDGQGGHQCNGGPHDGLACTPETSPLGAGYPTSGDCPTGGTCTNAGHVGQLCDTDADCGGVAQGCSGSNFLGFLSVPFALTTGTASKIATTLGGQANAFCGFCRDLDSNDFQQPAVACTSNADCTDPVFTTCQQKDGGAFNFPSVSKITETGTPAGDLRDRGPHGATLASVFCLPPAFNPLVDSAAGLPGPGATALPGILQLLP